MKMVSMIFALTLVASATVASAANPGLRSVGQISVTPLKADGTVKIAADELLHLLAEDETKDDKGDEDEKKETESDSKDNKKGEEKKTSAKKDEKAEKTEKKKDEKTEKKKEEKKTNVTNTADDMTLEEFLPGCLVHTAEIVEQIDGSYTDEQIKVVLENECWLDKEFPVVVDAGFKDHKACMKFAQTLTDARHEELATGSTKGYKTFCIDFFNHKATPDLTKGKDVAGPGFQWVWRAWVIGIALALFIAGVLVIHFTQKKEESPALTN